MKQRLTSLDLKILVPELEKCIKGHRLQNIYNLVNNNKSFLLKFSIPESKYNVVFENGQKLYLTEFQRPTQPEPSHFVSKLRKHLKTKRLTNIKQVGDDRIVVMEFSDGFYYLVLEFFSAGNILLLDTDMKVISLFRNVNAEGAFEEGQYDIGGTYSMFAKSLFEEETKTETSCGAVDNETILQWIKDTKQEEREKKKVLSVEKLCFQQMAHLSSDLIHISMLENGLNPTTSCLELLTDSELLDSVVFSINKTQEKYNQLLDTPVGEVDGYILSKKNPLFDESSEPSLENLEYVYDEFHPFEPVHKARDNVKIESFKGYNKTVDKFFTTIEMSKVSLGRQTRQANIQKRLQFVKDEHAKKLQALDAVQELNFKKGYLINVYNEQIEQCKHAVQTLINQKMDWKNIEKLVEIEKTRGNDVAKMIKSLNLLKNEITVTLIDIDEESEQEVEESEDEEWSDSDNESDTDSTEKPDATKLKKELAAVDVVIDITQSAFANSSRYFDAKKNAQERQGRTAKSAAIAIKSSEKKINLDMKKMEKEARQNVEFKQLRPKHWFEKFYWFISNEGYLCVAGRDETQVDSIYYRYFDNETDLLVSNDLEGALKVFIKNPYKNKDVPPTTFMQAGIFSLSTTKAWENKLVTSPWYVSGKDISKKDFDNTILPSGMLNVSKEKNYLPPCQMVMGAGLLFVADNETFKKYKTNKINRDEELELVCLNRTEGSSKKIEELKTMLRKLQEAQKNNKDHEEASSKTDKVEEVEDSVVEDEPVLAPTPSQQTQTKIRGKKNKLKKIKEKYGEQDEEERRLRMSVLGTLKQIEQNNKSDIVEKDGAGSRTSVAAKNERKRQTQINQITKLIDELETKPEYAEETEEEEFFKLINNVENYHLNISGLLPSPNKTDKVIDCIPIFAPWGALTKFAYKVKLQPGNLKKGKTVNDVLEVFKRQTKELQKEENGWYDQSNLIELINPQEFMMSLTASKFKVSSGVNGADSKSSKGGNKFKVNSKSKGKKK